MTTGEKIRAERQKAGLTQKQLGELCGIAEPTIRRYELDKLNPKRETLQKIAKPLGIHYLDLCSDEENNEFAAFFKAGMRFGSRDHLSEDQLYDISTEYVRYLQKQGYEFTESERQAVILFNRLNGITQEKVITDLARLCLNPRYREDGKPGVTNGAPQQPPESTPAPQEGKDTAPPPDAPETPPEGE